MFVRIALNRLVGFGILVQIVDVIAPGRIINEIVIQVGYLAQIDAVLHCSLAFELVWSQVIQQGAILDQSRFINQAVYDVDNAVISLNVRSHHVDSINCRRKHH